MSIREATQADNEELKRLQVTPPPLGGHSLTSLGDAVAEPHKRLRTGYECVLVQS